MKQQYLSLLSKILQTVIITFLITIQLNAQTVQITANPSQSQNIVVGPFAYHVSEAIYTDTEIGASNFTSVSTAINHIDFNVQTIGANTTVNNYNIYLRDIAPDTTTFTNTTESYHPGLYTLVFSGTFTPNVTGWVGVDFTTSFIRTTGKNLVLLIERLDNLPHAGYFFRSTLGNNTSNTITTSRRVNPNTLPVPDVTLLTTLSTNRPQVQLRHIYPNDATVSQVYTLGKLPIPFAAPHVISAVITNNGSVTLNNLPVTLDITGANIFNDVQSIPSLARGASATVTFSAFAPSVIGNNTVTVSVPADDFNNDNIVNIPQVVSSNAYTYAYGNVATGSLGITKGNSVPKTGDIVAKFITNSPTSVNQVGVTFAAGGIPFKIGIWDKSGNGVPGNLLWQSDSLTTTLGVFTLPVNPPISVTDTFYVGVRQTTTTVVQFAYQNEAPVRANTFFYDTLSKATWIDFASSNGGPFRFMIEPRLTLANDVGVSTLNNPIAATSVDNCGIVPKATISNFGSNNQGSPFNVTYIIKQGGNVVYNDTKSTSLLSGESKELSFAAFIGSVTGSDSSICITNLATDDARNNDTLVNSFTTNNYSYGGGAMSNGSYVFANSTICATPSPYKPTYNWIDPSSATEINWGINGDDSVLNTAIPLPFAFRFFGIDYSQFWICSNGWISFTDPTAITADVQKNRTPIPTAGGINNYIAGMLADLDLTTGTYADAHTYYDGDATQFVITFLHAHLKNSLSFISFQIILKPDGNIFIQYNDAQTTSPVPSSVINQCSIGIENATGSEGIQYRLNGNFGPMFGSPMVVRFRPPFTIPVILLNFTAQRANRINKISWSTSQELKSKWFVIERSTDGTKFDPIGQVNAAGNSSTTRNYLFTDNAPVKGINYYRLKIIDIDNNIRYSLVRNIRNEGIADISTYPNPVKDLLTTDITADKPGIAHITISDNSGRLVYTNTASIVEGSNKVSINTATLPAGAYILKMQLSGDVVLKKINKL